MIDLTYDVACDGLDEEGEYCKAAFFHYRPDTTCSVQSLRNELEKRGWSVVSETPLRVRCPLHKKT